jgi:hypothetical protein
MVGMFVGGQGRPWRGDLAKALNFGLKGERRVGVEGEIDFGLDFLCVGEGGCWERARVRRCLYITYSASRRKVRCA